MDFQCFKTFGSLEPISGISLYVVQTKNEILTAFRKQDCGFKTPEMNFSSSLLEVTAAQPVIPN